MVKKLNGVIAVEKDYKNHAHKIGSEIHLRLKKPDFFNGQYKTYQKKKENDDTFPPDNKHVQYKVPELLNKLKKAYIPLYNITIQKDEANSGASADIVVDNKVIYANVPVTALLFIEKQLKDHRTTVEALPVLDKAEAWTEDKSDPHMWRAAPSQTIKTSKEQEGLVLHGPTEHHPAQTAIITKDRVVGHWNTEKVSGAIQQKVKDRMLDRVDVLLHAVTLARETANDKVVGPDHKLGEAVYAFLEG